VVRTARKAYRCDRRFAYGQHHCPHTIAPGERYLRVEAAPWQDGADEVQVAGGWVRRWRVARYCATCGPREYPCHAAAFATEPDSAA
jgi:hypothetical protein